ncbi:MAG TPA: RNA 2',3'-cyclic phosphodiesterase [Bryobacteraceae bacterium]|nr:RNA 2',3'-cyclic phosphodiesterase [Bryobacteraceae bacterium]
MRLFTGIDVPEEIVHNLERLLARLRPTARLRWSPLENLHITTKFLGEWPEQRLDEVNTALRAVPGFAPARISVRRLGFFPNPHAPRVFWAGIEASPDLAALAERTDALLANLGVPREDRPFSPHLTLARIQERVPLQALRETIAGLPSLDFGEFVAERFYLYLSRRGPNGSVYTKISEFPISK